MSEEEGEVLERNFSGAEVKAAVFESYSDGTPCLNGISFMLYQKFWEIIKIDLIEMF
jgi:hypothetical protein